MAKVTIELDCADMPPGCGFECGACIQEIKDTLDAMGGVSGFAQHLDGRIDVEYDPGTITVDRILETISTLPTTHEGSFLPRVIAE